MKRLNFAGTALSIGVAAAFLAACGGGTSGFPAGSVDAHAYAKQTTFKYTGGAQIFNVPNGVYQIQIDATGGNGESTVYGNTTTPGGYGGRVVATLSVKPYEQLIVYVGGNGSGPTGGFNGGAEAGIGEISSSDLAGAGGPAVCKAPVERAACRELIAATMAIKLTFAARMVPEAPAEQAETVEAIRLIPPVAEAVEAAATMASGAVAAAPICQGPLVLVAAAPADRRTSSPAQAA